MSEEGLREKLEVVCETRRLLMGEAWVQKVLQLKQVGKPQKQGLCRETTDSLNLDSVTAVTVVIIMV